MASGGPDSSCYVDNVGYVIYHATKISVQQLPCTPVKFNALNVCSYHAYAYVVDRTHRSYLDGIVPQGYEYRTRSSADAEIARYASRKMPSKCKTSQFSHPTGSVGPLVFFSIISNHRILRCRAKAST